LHTSSETNDLLLSIRNLKKEDSGNSIFTNCTLDLEFDYVFKANRQNTLAIYVKKEAKEAEKCTWDTCNRDGNINKYSTEGTG
jgi:hypothetical protein